MAFAKVFKKYQESRKPEKQLTLALALENSNCNTLNIIIKTTHTNDICTFSARDLFAKIHNCWKRNNQVPLSPNPSSNHSPALPTWSLLSFFPPTFPKPRAALRAPHPNLPTYPLVSSNPPVSAPIHYHGQPRSRC